MTRRDLLLHLLQQAGPRGVTTGELLQAGVGSRYSLLELREQGYVISAERERDGSWRYTLIDSSTVRSVSTPTAPASYPAGAPGEPSEPSPPEMGSPGVGTDQTAAPQLFDTTQQEFDYMVRLSPYDTEAA